MKNRYIVRLLASTFKLYYISIFNLYFICMSPTYVSKSPDPCEMNKNTKQKLNNFII